MIEHRAGGGGRVGDDDAGDMADAAVSDLEEAVTVIADVERRAGRFGERAGGEEIDAAAIGGIADDERIVDEHGSAAMVEDAGVAIITAETYLQGIQGAARKGLDEAGAGEAGGLADVENAARWDGVADESGAAIRDDRIVRSRIWVSGGPVASNVPVVVRQLKDRGGAGVDGRNEQQYSS